jgi:hypothetical protein
VTFLVFLEMVSRAPQAPLKLVEDERRRRTVRISTVRHG